MVAPLDNIRVLEVASWVAAPSAAALMADMGATVIKVEPPGGDAYRYSAAYRQLPVPPERRTTYGFELDNRGKRSITLELGAPGAIEVVQRLAASADVFVTNQVQRRRGQFGLTVEELQTLNPRLIYASFSGYGTEGPEADRAGFDLTAFWARAGVQGLLGQPHEPPPLSRPAQGDHTSGLNLLAAIFAALRLRDQSGAGQVVDITLLGTGLWTVASDMAVALWSRSQPARHDRAKPPNPLGNSYRCSDGRWLVLVMAQPERFWKAFCTAIDRPEWLDHDRFGTLQERLQHAEEFTRELDAIFATADLKTWCGRLDAAGLIWAPVSELPDLIDDETLRGLGAFSEIEHPLLGSFKTLSAPFRIHGAEIMVRGPAPWPGEHTSEVLSEYGYSEDEIAELAAAGVFG